MTASGFRSFEFDLPAALLVQLIQVLDGMEAGPLLPAHVAEEVPEAQGVYQLFHNGKLVYIGKTDAESGLRHRLARHALAILSRHRLDVAEMSFKAVRVLVFSAMDLETALIRHYREEGSPSAWNGSGFGNNDPGRQRDMTALREDGFDANYPINIDLPIDVTDLGQPKPIFDLLAQISSRLPYTLRHEKTAAARDILKDVVVSLPGPSLTVREIMCAVTAPLPAGWQATRLPGRVILYRERQDNYPGAEIIARS